MDKILEACKNEVIRDFINEILAFRKEHNLTQQAFADLCDISQSSAARILSGNGRISLETAIKIKLATGIKL